MRGHGRAVDGRGLWWKQVARNKRTVALNLGRTEGAELLLELVREADVLVENFRPGTLERWGLSPQILLERNPRLVIVRVTGFGQEGPYRDRPAFGTLVEAMSGFAYLTGQPDGPPTLPPFGLADSISGMAGVSATLMALYHRDVVSGRGQVVDLDLLGPMTMAIGPAPAALRQDRRRAAAAGQPLGQQRAPQPLPHGRTATGSRSRRAPIASPRGYCVSSGIQQSSTSRGSPQAPSGRSTPICSMSS